jgi:hypothetical protein
LIAQEIDAAGALVTVTAVDSILDAGGPTNDITALAVSLTAANAIGTITTFGVANIGADSNGAGDAIEITVTTLSLVQTTAANSTIHLVQSGTLSVTAGAVNVAGLNTGQAIIQTTGNLNAGAVLPIDLTGNDSLALLSNATLTIPLAGFNAGTGDLRMVGLSDVIATGLGNLLFTADDLFFRSGGAGGDAVLNTTVNSVTARLDANDLTIVETNGMNVVDVDVIAGSANISTIAGNLNITTVDASATAMLTAATGSLTDANAGAVNVTATSLVASAAANINLDTAVANITATSTVAGDIDIDESDNANVLNVAATSGSADISSIAGSLNVSTISATVMATLTATGVGGSITDANAGAVNVTAPDFLVNANVAVGSGVDPLDTNVQRLEGSGGAGGFFVTEQNTLDIGGISAQVGATASGDVVIQTLAGDLNVLETVSSTGQAVNLQAGGNVNLSTVSAATTATLTAVTGAIVDTNAGANNVAATSLVASAATGINLDTTVANITATTSGAGNIDIDESDNATVVNVAAAGGNADVSSNTGSLSVNTMSASAMAILTANSGTITDANAALVNVTAADFLVNANVIGSAVDPLDTDVAQLEAAADAGGLFIIDQNAMAIGGVSAQVGATATGDVLLQTLAGNLDVLEDVSSSGQSVSLVGGANLAVNAPVTANVNFTGTAGNDFVTTQAITATTGIVTFNAAGNANINGIVGAALNVVGSATNNLTTTQAITATTGAATLTAGANATFNGAVTAAQNVALAAGADLTTAQPVSSTAGGITFNAGNNAAVNGTVVAELGVVVNAGNNVNTSQTITSDTSSITLSSGNDIVIGANVNAISPGANVVLAAGRNDLAALSIVGGALVAASGGTISGATLAFAAGRYTALDNSINTTFPPLTQAQPEGTIDLIVSDALGTNYQVTVDWQEDNTTNPRIDVIPASINGNVVVSRAHIYQSTPQDNPSLDIPITVNVTQLAGGSILPSIGGRPLVAPLDANGVFTNNAVGISFEIVIPVLTPFSFVPTTPARETLPVIISAPTPPVPQVELASQPVQRGATILVSASSAYTSEGEERYYELRIVFFDANGQLRESPLGERINLNDERLTAIAPFDLSKLPELFGRLPADRYRIYLIEDGTERLVLDFIIQQGQPVEMPEVEEVEPGQVPAAEGAIDNAPFELQNEAGVPADGALNIPTNTLAPPLGNGTSHDAMRWGELRLDPSVGDRTNSFAERLGRSAFFAHGGVVAGVATLVCATSHPKGARREQAVDKLMERFDNRRRFWRRDRNTQVEESLP